MDVEQQNIVTNLNFDVPVCSCSEQGTLTVVPYPLGMWEATPTYKAFEAPYKFIAFLCRSLVMRYWQSGTRCPSVSPLTPQRARLPSWLHSGYLCTYLHRMCHGSCKRRCTPPRTSQFKRAPIQLGARNSFIASDRRTMLRAALAR